jgi:hypothetical protein
MEFHLEAPDSWPMSVYNLVDITDKTKPLAICHLFCSCIVFRLTLMPHRELGEAGTEKYIYLVTGGEVWSSLKYSSGRVQPVKPRKDDLLIPSHFKCMSGHSFIHYLSWKMRR